MRNYFDAGEKAHTLYTLVKSEPESDLKLNPYFKIWMEACQKRNEKAYEVVRAFRKEELKALLGEKGVDILWEKNHKHEQALF